MIIIKRNAGDAESVMSYMHNLYFDSAAMILALVSLGKFLEEKAKSRTESAVTALKKLIPKTANIVVNGEIKEVQIKDLKTGDVLAVKAGEGFAADCTVVSGAGDANESALTGESMPVDKAPGASVSGGTIQHRHPGALGEGQLRGGAAAGAGPQDQDALSRQPRHFRSDASISAMKGSWRKRSL